MTKKLLGSLLLFLFPLLTLSAQGTDGNTYTTAERMFYITRSLNRNLVCYDAHLENGKLDSEDPIKVYWVDREKHPGKTEGLNYIQRKMAYGYKLISQEGNNYICSLSAYPKRHITMTQKSDGTYVCYITINNERAILQSLYVKSYPKNSLKVEYVELRGISLQTNKEISEKIKP